MPPGQPTQTRPRRGYQPLYNAASRPASSNRFRKTAIFWRENDKRSWVGFCTSISDTAFKFFAKRGTGEGGVVHLGIQLVDVLTSEARKGDAPVHRHPGKFRRQYHTANCVVRKSAPMAGISTVRKLAGIRFFGESTPLNWVRFDAAVATDMPDSRIGPVSIKTQDHGNVLWAPMDHGTTRTGFPYTSQMRERYTRESRRRLTSKSRPSKP